MGVPFAVDRTRERRFRCAFSTASLVFQAAEPLGDWFRSRLQSCWPALISCAAAVAAGLCQLGLLLGGGQESGGSPWPTA